MIGDGVLLYIFTKCQMYTTFYIGLWNIVFAVIVIVMILYLRKIKPGKSSDDSGQQAEIIDCNIH